MESKIVVAHGAMVHSQYGRAAELRLQKAMEDAILQANREGIENSDANAPIIHQRMMDAMHRELLLVTREAYDSQVEDLEAAYRMRRDQLDHMHRASLDHAANALREELASIHARLSDAEHR